MNGDKALVASVSAALNDAKWGESVQVVVAPPLPLLSQSREAFRSHVQISAQNCSSEKTGAFTGETSVDLLKDLGIEWVILGHSERRELFHETDNVVAKKVAFAVKNGVKVIACVGEKLLDRESGQTMQVVVRQLDAIRKSLDVSDWKSIVIAYEPVWAIGTGKVATPAQAQDTHLDIRKYISDSVSPAVAEQVRIIYGGSVNAKNCGELQTQGDIDGFLVGGASLKSADFLTICNCKL